MIVNSIFSQSEKPKCITNKLKKMAWFINNKKEEQSFAPLIKLQNKKQFKNYSVLFELLFFFVDKLFPADINCSAV